MIIRAMKEEDLPAVMDIYAGAREFMKRIGNPNQWRDSWPPRDVIEQDIQDGIGYVVEENGTICGAFACWYGDHPEPTYDRIYNGSWITEGPYAVIHRIAAIEGSHAGRYAIEQTIDRYHHVRIDTHHDNAAMRHTLKRIGFTECGIIYLENGEERVALEISR